MSISALPAVATSWWCFSTRMPTFSISRNHLGADVLLRVGRRNGEVAFLVARLVAEVLPSTRRPARSLHASLRAPVFHCPSAESTE
jgi:hypothetical protein